MSQFSYRPTRVNDVARCVELLRQDRTRTALFDEALLARLLDSQTVVSRVFEERCFDGSTRLWGCGFSAFVTPQVAAQAHRGEIPDLVDTLVASQHGREPMLLDRDGQAQHNAAGQMHMVMLGFTIDDSPSAPTARITPIGHEAFLVTHSGYGLCSYCMEVSDLDSRAAMLRQSALAMDFAPAPQLAGAATQVYFLTEDMFDQRPFHAYQSLFLRNTPRLGLTPAQQELLVLALLGHSDDELAAELGIAWNTVRKRWRAIFEQAEQALPGLFGDVAAGRSSNTRGVEKRRPLLGFLASHPEELRPWPRRA